MTSSSFDYILIDAIPFGQGKIATGYALIITPRRRMTFEYAGKTYTVLGASKSSYSGTVGRDKFLNGIDQLMDDILVNYLKANPKKE